MGGHDDGRTRLTDLFEQTDDIVSCLGVEVSRRLIGDDDPGFVQDGPCNGDTLLLTARQLMGHLVLLVSHPHHLQYLVDAFLNLLLVLPSCGFQYETQVLCHRPIVQQLEVLEDDTHLLPQCRNLPPSYVHDVAVEYHCLLTALDVQFTIGSLQERALSRAHLTDDVDELAFLHVEVNIVQHTYILLENPYFLVFYQHSHSCLGKDDVYSISPLLLATRRFLSHSGSCLFASSRAMSSMRMPLSVSNTSIW